MAPTPPFTDEHEQLRASARGFIERELTPHAQQWEEEQWFPDEVFGKLAAQGLLGLCFAVCVPDALHHHLKVGLGYLHEMSPPNP